MKSSAITNDFITGVNLRTIRTNTLLIKAALLISILFLIAEIILWYKIALTSFYFIGLSVNNLILPITIVVILFVTVLSWFYNSKGSKLIEESIKKNDSMLFNKGYTSLTVANFLSLLCLIVAIVSALIEIFIRN